MGAVSPAVPSPPRNPYHSLRVVPVPYGEAVAVADGLGTQKYESVMGGGELAGTLWSLLSAQQCGANNHCEMDCEVNNEVRVP